MQGHVQTLLNGHSYFNLLHSHPKTLHSGLYAGRDRIYFSSLQKIPNAMKDCIILIRKKNVPSFLSPSVLLFETFGSICSFGARRLVHKPWNSSRFLRKFLASCWQQIFLFRFWLDGAIGRNKHQLWNTNNQWYLYLFHPLFYH